MKIFSNHLEYTTIFDYFPKVVEVRDVGEAMAQKNAELSNIDIKNFSQSR